MCEPVQSASMCQPVSAEEFAEWFDSDGRLVREVTMRQRVFEGNTNTHTHAHTYIYTRKHCSE